jgi:hypothetical protein
MKSNRGVIVAVVAFVVACLSGAASLLARVDAVKLPAVPATPTPVSLLLAKQGRIHDCSDQDDDDDRDEAKAGKPDTDDIELQCGDQNDDEAPHAAKLTKAGK